MTHYMNHKMEQLDIPSIPEFVEMIADTGAGMYACKASVDLFGLEKNDFIEQVQDIITVGEFYEIAAGRPDHLHLSRPSDRSLPGPVVDQGRECGQLALRADGDQQVVGLDRRVGRRVGAKFAISPANREHQGAGEITDAGPRAASSRPTAKPCGWGVPRGGTRGCGRASRHRRIRRHGDGARTRPCVRRRCVAG